MVKCERCNGHGYIEYGKDKVDCFKCENGYITKEMLRYSDDFIDLKEQVLDNLN